MSSPHFNSFIVLSWNCNSLHNKINELRHFVDNHPHIDAILIQETRKPHNNINISGFKLYHTLRSNQPQQGGTAVYIRNHIPHHATNSTDYSGLDHTDIIVDLPNFKFNLTSIYIPPNRPLPTNSLDTLFSQHNHCFIAGDYNSHNRRWQCYSNTQRGNSLHTFITHNNLSLHVPDKPTRIPTTAHGRPSTIDFAITKNFPYPITATTINDLSSDHLPVAFKIDLLNPISPPPSVAINWSKFTAYLNDHPLDFPNANNTDDIDTAVEILNTHIVKAQEHATRPKFKNNYSFVPPPYILNLIKRRNQLRREYQTIRDPNLKREINSLNNNIKNSMLNHAHPSPRNTRQHIHNHPSL